ncbi:MAG: histidinol-phosphate transaminase [Breznakibacter sp.]
MKSLQELVRPNIFNLKPYSSARDEFTGEASVYLDANESPYNSPYNRYPDPYQRKLKKKVAELKQVAVEQIFLGNGSDEPIDLLIKAFCTPGTDNIISIDPTYGMYQVAADINEVEVRRVALTASFELNTKALLDAADDNSKLLFICSPNNPTGNSFKRSEILEITNAFQGIVVLDEAYIDFSSQESLLPELNQHPNLVVLQTFSKAWGMAGLRLGMAFASKEIIGILNKIKYPYNINILTQEKVLEMLQDEERTGKWVATTIEERGKMARELENFSFVTTIHPSDANFLLIRTLDANGLYKFLVDQKIIVRNRSTVTLCNNCIRITIGSPEENQQILEALKQYQTITA